MSRAARKAPAPAYLRDRWGALVPALSSAEGRRAAENAAITTLNRDLGHIMLWQGYGECCKCSRSAHVALGEGGWTAGGDAAAQSCGVAS